MRFSNSPWNKIFFKDIANFSKGNGLSKDLLSNKGIKCILYGELYTKYIPGPINKVISKTTTIPQNPVYSKKNDIILPASGESNLDISTACCLQEDNILLGGDLNIIRVSKHDGSFICYQLIGKRKFDVAKIAQGASIVHLHNSDLEKLKLFIPPSLADELKISSFLNVISERIVTQKKIIEELINLKNGIKNIMFCSAKTTGKLYTLKELSLYFNGVAHENNISENGLTLINSKFISTEGQIKKYVNKSEFILNKNDICFVLSDLPNGKALSKCFYIDENNQYALNQRIACIRSKDVILSKYLYYYLSRNKYFLRFDDGVSQTNLKKDEVLNCPVYYDINLTSFVNELEIIDDKILNEKKILSLYEIQKQYLLNKLFI